MVYFLCSFKFRMDLILVWLVFCEVLMGLFSFIGFVCFWFLFRWYLSLFLRCVFFLIVFRVFKFWECVGLVFVFLGGVVVVFILY